MEISLSITTLIFLLVVCLSGGIVIGGLFARAGKMAQDSLPPAAQEQESQTPPPAPPAQKSLADAGDVELLRIWRQRSSKLWLEMDGQRLDSKDQMTAEQKKRLVNLLIELRPWLDVPPKEPKPAPVSPPPRPSTLRPVAPSPAVVPPPPAAQTKPPLSLKSIVEQIDDILQEKLSGTAFAGREIHLLEGLSGGVIVQIEKQHYDGIDAVPDAEIKALIRLSVSEWEKSSG